MAKISAYTAQTTINDTDQFILEQVTPNNTKKTTWATIKSNLSALLDPEPIGTIKAWDKTFPSTPTLSSSYVECDGSVISDAGSVYNTYRSRNLNGANVVLTLTWTPDAGGSYATVVATDLTALAVGDDVTGTGIAASSYISDITGATVTITDISATGSISSTFTNRGRFLRGNSASGVGANDAMQRITGEYYLLDASYGIGRTGNLVSGALKRGTATVNGIGAAPGSASNAIAFDNAASISPNTAKTDDVETYPINLDVVYIMKIK